MEISRRGEDLAAAHKVRILRENLLDGEKNDLTFDHTH